jgi:hypothetical protein
MSESTWARSVSPAPTTVRNRSQSLHRDEEAAPAIGQGHKHLRWMIMEIVLLLAADHDPHHLYAETGSGHTAWPDSAMREPFMTRHLRHLWARPCHSVGASGGCPAPEAPGAQITRVLPERATGELEELQ